MTHPSTTRSTCGTLAALLLLGACTDGPASPGPRPEAGFLVTAYECTVNVPSGTTTCQARSIGGGGRGPMLDIIAGSPYVSMSGSALSVSNGNPANPDTLTLTWTLHNNLPQPIGTSDGTTPHANGSRIFFQSGPTVTAVSSGSVATASVAADNSLGPATFTSTSGFTYSNRRYYQLNGVMAPNDSASTLVRFVYTPRVTSFSYGLLVAAPVPYEYGWITVSPTVAPVLAPGGTTTLTGTVYNERGNVQMDGISWSSSDLGVATVHPLTGVVTGWGEGTAVITATSNAVAQRVGTRTITVDVAPTVISTTPADNYTGVPVASDIIVTFSEAVNVSTSSFSLECPTGWAGTFTVSGSGTSTITLNPNSNLPAATVCDVTVVGSQVSDTDANDGPDVMAGTYAFSFQTS